MPTLLKKQIAYTENKPRLSIFAQAWLLVLHILLGFYHVMAMLFLSSSNSFQQVHDLTDNGYKVSYLDHCRLQHNVRFGTLAYSLVLVGAITLVRTTVEIIYPEQFGQAVYAANLIVNSSADTDDGACTAGLNGCTLREALNAGSANDVIKFDPALTNGTIVLSSSLTISAGQTNLVIDGETGNVTVDCNHTVGTGLSILAEGVTISNFTINNCTQTGISIANDDVVVDTMTINEPGLRGILIQGDSNTVTGTTIAATTITPNCIEALDNSDSTAISSNVLSICQTGINLGSGSNTLLDHNIIYQTTQHLIVISGATSPSIISNYFGLDASLADSTFTGYVLVENTEQPTISQNQFANGTTDNLWVDQSDGATIQGNAISGASGFDNVTIIDSANVQIASNTFSTGQSALRLENDNAIAITDNTFSDYQNVDSSGYTISLDSSADSIVDGNTFTDNTTAGIIRVVNGSDTIAVSNNQLTSTITSDQAAILIQSSDAPTITGNTITLNSSNSASGRGIVLKSQVADAVLGYDLSDTGEANTISADLPIVLNGSTVTGAVVRHNTLTTESGDYVSFLNGAADPTPANTSYTGHSLAGISGQTDAGALVDLYGLSGSTATWLDAVTAGSDGSWTYTADLTAYDTIYTTVSTVAGTGAWYGDAQPTSTVEISDLTVSEITETTAKLSWTTNISTTADLHYNPTGSSKQSITIETAGTTHSYTLSGLTADTNYTVSVTAYAADNNLNFTNSDNTTFDTDGASGHTTQTLSQYADHVANTIRVKHRGGYTVVDATEDDDRQFTFGNLTFSFKDRQHRLADDYRVHFILKTVEQHRQTILNKKKAFNDLGKAKFKVRQQQLALDKTYAVYSGVIDANGGYANDSGLARRFTFSLIDAPQLLFPSTPVFYRMPEEFVVASKAPSVTVYVDDADGQEILHCVAIMSDGMGSCQPPFHVPGLGNYTIRLVDARGGSIRQSILLSDFAPGSTITTDTRSVNFYKRLVYTGQPTFNGVVATGHTVELHIPQINGAMQADVAASSGPTSSWTFQLLLTTLPYGDTDVTIIDRNEDGSVASQTDYEVYRAFHPVLPAVIAPDSGQSFVTAPAIQVIGSDDHSLEVFNSDGTLLVETGFINGGAVLNLAEWYDTLGTQTVTLRTRNGVNIPSADVTFTFTLIAERTNTTSATTAIVADTNTDTNTNTDTPVVPLDPNADTDGDTMSNGDEVTFGSDPLLADEDQDGLTDPQEYTLSTRPRDADTDDDGVLDGTEVALQTSPTDSDSDDDGLSDNERHDYNTLPLDADTDNDRILDGDEIKRQCDPLKADTDNDGIDDLTEALAGTACTSPDNVWGNLTGLEAYLQDQARQLYASTGKETASYPHLTNQVVSVDQTFKQNLNHSITSATVVDYVPGAETVVSKGAVTTVTRTTKLSLFDWLNGEGGTTSDDTLVTLKGQIDLPAAVQGQPAYVVVTFFSTPTVKIAQVDPNGQWTMTVPAELLTTGDHTAFASVDVNGTQSDQVQVAKFVIQHERRLSNTAWLVIVNLVIAIIALLVACFIQLRHKRAQQLKGESV